MTMTVLKIQCILACLYLNVQNGLSGDFEAQLGRNFHLQPKVTDYHVKCSVVSRYAVTTVQSSVWNQLPVIKEAAFEVDLPSSAFISNFTITSNGKVYVAEVKERTAAKKIYDAAKKRGKTAGLVATKEREIDTFRVAVSVPSGTRMSFSLTYEELLPRRLGRYELSLGLRPGQLVQNLTLDVGIHERTGINFFKILPLKTSRLLSNSPRGNTSAPASTHVEHNAGCARVFYHPTLQQQNSISSKGLNANFIIQYDVDLDDLMGDVQVYDGYFVHYFAPRGLPVVPKDVIFVIDVSGSMIGTKMFQTKQAMNTILGDLREGDHFNIITFSDKINTWKKGRTVRATRQNVREAKEFVRRIIAEGWTNINAALISAAQLVNPSSSGSSSRYTSHRVPLVIFLTDGEATIGETSSDTILNNAKKALGSASLFGLAFGDDADFLLLKRLALDNRGAARMVYEDADAAIQLKGFYDEVASPLLSDIQLSYLDDQAFDVTQSLFPNYFQGSELVVAGRVKPGIQNLKVSLSAADSKKQIKLDTDVSISHTRGNGGTSPIGCLEGLTGISSFVHRLWAYFTIKELLLAKLNTTDPVIQKLLTEKATNLSLNYNFVTPVTSLVVVKPDAEETAQTPTPAKPTTAATTVTTAIPPTNLFTASVAKKPSSPSNLNPNKSQPNPPHPPPGALRKKTNPLPPTSISRTSVPPSKKVAATLRPRPRKTAPAPFFGKKPIDSQNNFKSATPPSSVRKSTSLLNTLKTVQPPSPGKNDTSLPDAMRVTTPSTTTNMLTVGTSISPLLTSSYLPPLPGRTSTQQPSSVTSTLPPVKVSRQSSERENITTLAQDLHRPETTTVPPKLLSELTSPNPALTDPAMGENDTNLNSDIDMNIATFVSGTFVPMPGVADGAGFGEAARPQDYGATYDYDYDLSYDTSEDTEDSRAFVLESQEDCPLAECLVLSEPPSRQNTVRILSSVDGDPHFVVQLPKLHQNLCFTVDGRPNDVLRLLEDPEQGIIVDGHLIGAPPKHGAEGRSRTYFNQLTISSRTGNSGDIMLTLSLDAVVVEGEGWEILPINKQGSVRRQGVVLTVDAHQNCWIELVKGVRFLVLFHHYKHPSYTQMAHLGFYVTDGRGLSETTQGLLGQFQHSDMSVTVVKERLNGGAHQPNKEEILARGILRWGSEQMSVTLQDKTLKDLVGKRHLSRCWVVPKAEIERLLGHSYESYVVDRV